MATHHLSERHMVRRATAGSGENLANLEEVVGSKFSRRGDRKEGGVSRAGILEPVNGAPWHTDRIAGADLDHLALDREGGHALEAIDRLLEAIVAVGCGHFL